MGWVDHAEYTVKQVDEEELAGLLPYDRLVEALNKAFADPPMVPQRQHYDIDVDRPGYATYLIMPAWQSDTYIGTKLATVMPFNTDLNLPTVSGVYVLIDSVNGQPLLLMDAAELTARRTAGTSALATRFLSRSDSRTLLMVGTGKLAPYIIAATASVRPVDRVLLWGRNQAKAEALANTLRAGGMPVEAATDLQNAAGKADIICCATTSREPIICGEWLTPGTHLDLTGAYRPDMREVDDNAVTQATIFADTRDGVLSEGGEVVQAINAGLIGAETVAGELSDLAAGRHPGRTAENEFTLFKSVGTAISDYGAACLAYESL